MYVRQIFDILMDAGEKGLKLAKIVRHVFNECNNLFEEHSYEEVKKSVVAFVVKNSRTRGSAIEKTSWGVYRINRQSSAAKQLLIDFNSHDRGIQEKEFLPDSDPTLSLFDDDTL